MTAANVLLFLLLLHHGLALDILAIVSLPLHSHYMAFRTLFHELAIRGHHVTVINNFPDKDPPPNLRFVDIQFERLKGTPTLDFYERLDCKFVHYLNMYRHITLGEHNVRLDCGYLFNSANVKAHLAEGRKYDVIFVEQFMSDCALAYALALYDAPIIGISSHVMLPFAYPRLGIPFDVAADQFYFSKAGPNPTLFEKLETFLFSKFITGIGRWALHRHIYAAFDQHLPNHSLDIERDAKARMKMMFSYQHHSVTGARLMAPQLLEIGGIHIRVHKAVPKNVVAVNILAIISLPLRSHYMAFKSFFHELACKGHNVTIMNNYPEDTKMSNLRFIDLQADFFNFTTYARYVESYETSNSNIRRLINVYRLSTTSMVEKDCENLINNENAKRHYAEGGSYDVIFVEQFVSDCGLVYAAAMYDAPIIGITSHALFPCSYSRMGLSLDLSADTFYFSNGGPNPSLFHKVDSVLIATYWKTFGSWYLQRKIKDVFKKYRTDYYIDVEKIAKERMAMMFVYQHFSLTGAQALPPQVLEIGGTHIGSAKPVPQDIEEFLADAKHGAIYVSFGSNLKAGTMSARRLQQFLTAFRRLPQKIIWKFENATFTEKNIMTSDWFPQLDILCHPKVVGFVSHGGMLSLSESAHCGKPLLTMPFFGDQFSNAAALRAVGMGVTLYFDQLDENNLEAAVKEITSDKMQQNAKRVSKLWHDRPMPVMDSAIYWTEYVARHKTAPPSLPSKNNSWYDSLLIDVAVVIIALVAILVFLVYLILKFIKYVLLRILGLFFTSKIKEE